MQGRARALFATAGCLAVALPFLGGCSDRYAPDEAPGLASSASIPVAAPGATGVAFESPRPYGAAARPGYPKEPAEPVPENEPLPLPEETPPSPLEPPAAPSASPQNKRDGGGAVTGPVSKGVQL